MSTVRRAALLAALYATACTQPTAPRPASPANAASAPAATQAQAAHAAQDEQATHEKAQPAASRKASAVLGPDEVWIDSLDLSLMFQEWGQARAGRSVDGR